MKLKFCISLFVFLILILSGCGKKAVTRDEVFDAEKFLSQADKLIQDKQFEEARKILTEVKNRDATKKHIPIAHLKIADSYIKEEDIPSAIEEYRKFIELYPDNRYASYAQYQIAMAYFNEIESPDRGSGSAQKALKEFLLLKEKYPRNPFRDIVELRIQKCKNVIAEGEFLVGEFYFKKGSYKAAINRLQGLIEQFPQYIKNDEALFLIAKAYQELKMTDKAKEFFSLLIQKYPTSRFVSEAKKRFN
ncbi:MAG: outer membrane protein assembly factor BamD [Thermodesulfovibrionales bacterium]|nr:outer membrane protein assembly factor BamD [Thermodesulfovibrionales bacterium]